MTGTRFQDQLTNPVLAQFYTYWRSLTRGKKLPRRGDVDPRDIPALLPYLFMIDVGGTPADPTFTYRLAGTELVETYGMEFTGKTPQEAFPGRSDDLVAAYRKVVSTGAPMYDSYQAPVPGREHITVERLICPLAGDGLRVAILIGVLAFGS
ncbi:MAG: PAS domain-containing protein [Alphaproteobacteria bacterium]|nr:PAS domain-containing protein [Alphaproteobacteria bacterium]